MKRISAELISSLRSRIRGFDWNEIAMLVTALVAFVCGYLVIELADEVKEGSTQTIDEWVLRSLRRDDGPAVRVGPAWLREAGLDLTALGSPVVLLLVVIAAVGFMCLRRRYGLVMFTILTTLSGWAATGLLKYWIGRDRPTIVPHLREVSTPSFPSGHAMVSAIVYLTLGTLLMQAVAGRAAKLYCLIMAMLLTMLVGISRIYLGVHYPTDVLAGWIAGVGWALSCWTIIQYSRRRAGCD